MATTFRLESQKVTNGRYMYLTCTQTKDIAANKSTISWTLTVTGGSTANYIETGPTTVKIAGQTVYNKSSITHYYDKTFPAAKGSVDSSTYGTVEITHDQTGAADPIECSIKTSIYDGSTGRRTEETRTGTWTLDRIPRQAQFTTPTANFNDLEDPIIYFENPAGELAEIHVAIFLADDTVISGWKSITPTHTSHKFNMSEIRSALLANTPRPGTTGNTISVGFFLKTLIDGAEIGTAQDWAYFTITDPNPTFSPEVEDSYDKTFALTGNRKTFVQYHSKPTFKFNAVAQKGSRLTSQTVTNSTHKFTSNSESSAVCTFSATNGSVFRFEVQDSRGNKANPVTINLANNSGYRYVPYVHLTCNPVQTRPNGLGQFVFEVSGACFDDSFGEEDNVLHVEYSYKASDETEYGEWQSMSVSSSGNSYTAKSPEIQLDYQKTYVFRTRANDLLETLTENDIGSLSVTAKPTFDWSESDFNFNVPVSAPYITLQNADIDPNGYMTAVHVGAQSGGFELLEVFGPMYDKFGEMITNGLAEYGGSDEQIDPNTTSSHIILTNHANGPMGEGTFYYIVTIWYGGKSESAYRAQYGIPYNKNGSMYHRFFNGTWTDWRRHFNADELGDYVVERGSTDMWVWEKWSSGKAVCWGKKNFGTKAVTVKWGTAVYEISDSAVMSADFPSGLFVDTPYYTNASLLYGGDFDAVIVKSRKASPSKDNTGAYNILRGASGTLSNTTLGFYAIGRWK